MKKWIPGLLVFALCAGPAAANSIGFFVSSYAPEDTDSNEGVGLDLEFGSGAVEFEIRFSLYEDLVSDPNPLAYSLEAVPIEVGLNRNFGHGQRVTPYIGGGATYVVFDFTVDTTTGTDGRGIDIDPEAGYYVQAGVEVDINRTWEAFAEAIYRQVDAQAEGDDLGLAINQKIGMSGPAVNLGIAIRW